MLSLSGLVAIVVIQFVIAAPAWDTSASKQVLDDQSFESTTNGDYLRGVNIGSWLLLEKWLVPDLFNNTNAVDQYTFDQTPGSLKKLQKHWAEFFTEHDVVKLSLYGFNALRIPIGYWAYESFDEPYHFGADAWLEQAIWWAQTSKMKVLIDLHGAPGSQNGFDSSGKYGRVKWQCPKNLERTNMVLAKMVTKYGAKKFEKVVLGIQIINEPLSEEPNTFDTTKAWAQNITAALLENGGITNPNFKIIMHDAFHNLHDWSEVYQNLERSHWKERVGLDTHLYQAFKREDKRMSQDQHIERACKWRSELQAAKDAGVFIIVGEWSAVTDICVWPDGSTSGGLKCDLHGCQCTNVALLRWESALVEHVRKYVEAQIDSFEAASDGHFVWNFKGKAGAWSLYDGIEKGIFPKSIWDRQHPNICA